MKKYNLGTPATQADIIEKLKQKQYITKKNKSFIALEKGIILIKEIVDDKIKSVELTKTMENQLKAIRKGSFTRDEYIEQVHAYVRNVIEGTSVKENLVSKLQNSSNFSSNRNSIGNCPVCNSKVFEGKVNFYCSNQSCKFALWKKDNIWKKFKKSITKNRATSILKNKKIFVKGIGTFNLIINPKDSKYLTRWDIEFDTNKKA
jgi:DNA topoisomerase-3